MGSCHDKTGRGTVPGRAHLNGPRCGQQHPGDYRGSRPFARHRGAAPRRRAVGSPEHGADIRFHRVASPGRETHPLAAARFQNPVGASTGAEAAEVRACLEVTHCGVEGCHGGSRTKAALYTSSSKRMPPGSSRRPLYRPGVLKLRSSGIRRSRRSIAAARPVLFQKDPRSPAPGPRLQSRGAGQLPGLPPRPSPE